MSAYSDWEVQKAVFAKLAATGGVTALLSGGAASVHDHVPQDSGFPYIVLGDIAGKPLETATGGGRDLLLTLHVYSRTPGLKEARSIMAAIHAALHDADFIVTGQTLVLCREEGSSASVDSDGETRHGTMVFRIVTEPSA